MSRIVYEGWDAAPRIERALGDMRKVRHMTYVSVHCAALSFLINAMVRITGVDLETPVDTWMLKGTGWYDQVVRGRAPMASIKVTGKSLRTLPFAQGDPFNDIMYIRATCTVIGQPLNVCLQSGIQAANP